MSSLTYTWCGQGGGGSLFGTAEEAESLRTKTLRAERRHAACVLSLKPQIKLNPPAQVNISVSKRLDTTFTL